MGYSRVCPRRHIYVECNSCGDMLSFDEILDPTVVVVVVVVFSMQNVGLVRLMNW